MPESCMLIKQYNVKKIKYPALISPKLDGVRCIYRDGTLWTRNGKVLHGLDHIYDTIESIPDFDGQLDGELIVMYGFLYGLFRFVLEFFRAPDIQLGYICCGWMTMGQLLSLVMMIGSAILYIYLRRRGEVAQEGV